ncbi:MAG: ABC transporter substrate-binding protein [Mannheimia varigena]|nr:ABC transporter substrate-binding protein [Mannheimia varigena]
MNKLTQLALFSLAFAGSALAAPKTFTYCLESSPAALNPQIATDGATLDVGQALYNRLIDFEKGTTNLTPSLAERWEISEDGTSYIFYLRQNVPFHSNKNFTPSRNLNADDVIFSINRQLDQNNPYNKVSGGSYEFFYGMNMQNIIKNVAKIDDYTVKIELNAPNAPFLANLAMDFMAIFSAEYAEQMQKAGTPEKVDLEPIGTGAFQFYGYQKDATVSFMAFDNYWQGKAKIDRLVFSITPDASVRLAKLEKNECQAMPYPNPADLPALKANSNIQVLEKAGLNVGYITLNTRKPPFDNPKVRQALNYAVNKEEILTSVYQGSAIKAKNPMPPTIWGYNEEVTGYDFNPEKAKQLLKEAGLENGFETEIWAMPVSRPYNPNARRMAEMIQADWKAIGVNAKIVSYEWGEYLKRMGNGEHTTGMIGWTGDNGDPDNFLNALLSCNAVEQGPNYAGFCDKEFDLLVSEAATISDKNKRSELYQKAQTIFNEQAPWLPIAHSTVYFPVRKEVKGYIPSPFVAHNFYGIELE